MKLLVKLLCLYGNDCSACEYEPDHHVAQEKRIRLSASHPSYPDSVDLASVKEEVLPTMVRGGVMTLDADLWLSWHEP